MADLQAQFEQAVIDSKSLDEKPDNMTLLKLYALYKQASSGDADGKRPGFGDMVGRAKWDAWNGLAGKSIGCPSLTSRIGPVRIECSRKWRRTVFHR